MAKPATLGPILKMGNWGTSISSNDTYEDIYSTFFDLYNQELAVDKITSQIHFQFEEERESYEDSNNFWFALAKSQWDCGLLQEGVLEKVKDIIINKKDIQLWKELEATSQDLKKREKALDSFYEKIQSLNPKPKKRKKKVIRDAIFKAGDCLIFPLQNGNYGGVFVLEAEVETELGLNILAITTINKKSKPELKDFETAEILVQRDKSLYEYDRKVLQYGYAQFYKNSLIKFEVIGQLPISKPFNRKDHLLSAAKWDYIPSYLDNQKEYEEKNGKPKTKVKLSDLI